MHLGSHLQVEVGGIAGHQAKVHPSPFRSFHSKGLALEGGSLSQKAPVPKCCEQSTHPHWKKLEASHKAADCCMANHLAERQ